MELLLFLDLFSISYKTNFVSGLPRISEQINQQSFILEKKEKKIERKIKRRKFSSQNTLLEPTKWIAEFGYNSVEGTIEFIWWKKYPISKLNGSQLYKYLVCFPLAFLFFTTIVRWKEGYTMSPKYIQKRNNNNSKYGEH